LYTRLANYDVVAGAKKLLDCLRAVAISKRNANKIVRTGVSVILRQYLGVHLALFYFRSFTCLKTTLIKKVIIVKFFK
jgi:hypothetical protein